MYVEGLGFALLALGWWYSQRETEQSLARIEAGLRPLDPKVQAEERSKALARDMCCKAEQARLAEIAGAKDYDAYLAPIRAQIAAQNQR